MTPANVFISGADRDEVARRLGVGLTAEVYEDGEARCLDLPDGGLTVLSYGATMPEFAAYAVNVVVYATSDEGRVAIMRRVIDVASQVDLAGVAVLDHDEENVIAQTPEAPAAE